MKHTTGMYPSISIQDIDFRVAGLVASVLIEGQSVPICRQACNYGGYRHWFICPSCHQRKGKLFKHKGGVKCRTCADLTYFSSQTRCHYDKVYSVLKRYWGEGARLDREYARVYKQKRKQITYRGKLIKRLKHKYYD